MWSGFPGHGFTCLKGVKSSPVYNTRSSRVVRSHVVKDGTRIILFAEYNVVGKSNAEEVPFAEKEVKPYDDVVLFGF